MTQGFTPDLLVPTGRALLLGSFAWILVRSMRGAIDLHTVFERLAIGLLALVFFQSGAQILDSISEALSLSIGRIGERENLKELLLEAFDRSAKETASSGASTSFNIPALLEQAWRTGVWGVMTALVEGIFVIIWFFLECAQEVLWKLLLILFPLACGAYPVFPKLVSNLTLYAVELKLWFPMLLLIDSVTGSVARAHLVRSGSLGLYIVAVQLIAIAMILFIPSITHRFLSGAFSGDFDSQASLFRWTKLTFQNVVRTKG